MNAGRDDLLVECYDIMILYAEEDKPKAVEYLNHLNSIDLGGGICIRAVLYNGPELQPLAGSDFQNLEKAFGEHCTFAFIIVTPNLRGSAFMQSCYESCLMRTLTEDPDKRWCIKPVYPTDPKKFPKNSIPYGLNSLSGEAYFRNDEFYLKNIKALIQSKLYARDKNERNIIELSYQIIQDKLCNTNSDSSVDDIHPSGDSIAHSTLPPEPMGSTPASSGTLSGHLQSVSHNQPVKYPQACSEKNTSKEAPHQQMSLDSSTTCESDDLFRSGLEPMSLDANSLVNSSLLASIASRSNINLFLNMNSIGNINNSTNVTENIDKRVTNHNIEGATNVQIGDKPTINNIAGAEDENDEVD